MNQQFSLKHIGGFAAANRDKLQGQNHGMYEYIMYNAPYMLRVTVVIHVAQNTLEKFMCGQEGVVLEYAFF